MVALFLSAVVAGVVLFFASYAAMVFAVLFGRAFAAVTIAGADLLGVILRHLHLRG